jgi:O-antigen/teichoic acid export membrane protein
MNELPRRIGRSMALGAGWMVLMRWSDHLIGLVSTAILARILVPGDFGVLTLAMAIVSMLDMVGEFSVELALIRDQEAKPHHYDTAFTINLAKSVVFGVAVLLVADPYAAFMGDERLAEILPWIALSVAAAGFENIRVVDFRKGMRFDREFVYTLAPRLLATILTVVLAFLWADYWALVVGIMARRFLRVVMGYVMIPYRPRLGFVGFLDIFRFSRWLILRNLILAANRSMDKLILGKLAEAHVVGVYGVAKEIGELSMRSFVAPANRAFFPGYAQLATEPGRLKQGYLSVLSIMMIVALPTAIGIGATAYLIVPLFLGSQWLEAIPLVEILTLFAVIQICASNVGPVLMAANRPQVAMWRSLANLVFVPPAFAAGVHYFGVVGGAWAIAGTNLVGLIVNYTTVGRILDVALAEIGRAIWRPLAAALVMGAGLRGLGFVLPERTGLIDHAWQLVLLVPIGVSLHAGTLLGLWRACGSPAGGERTVLEAIGKLRAKVARRIGLR